MKKIEIYLNLIFWFYKQMKTWIALLQALSTTRPPLGVDFAQLSTYAPRHAYMAQGEKLSDMYLTWIGLEAFLHKGTWMWCVRAMYNGGGQKSKFYIKYDMRDYHENKITWWS